MWDTKGLGKQEEGGLLAGGWSEGWDTGIGREGVFGKQVKVHHQMMNDNGDSDDDDSDDG